MVKLQRKRRVPRLATVIEGPSMAKQSFKEECDINNILARYARSGIIDHLSQYGGSYGDFTNTPSSYQEAVEIVFRAQEMFASVPAKIRARFGNDPAEFLSFVEDPANIEELRQLGLAKPAPAAPPAAAVVPSAGAAPSMGAAPASSGDSSSSSGSAVKAP